MADKRGNSSSELCSSLQGLDLAPTALCTAASANDRDRRTSAQAYGDNMGWRPERYGGINLYTIQTQNRYGILKESGGEEGYELGKPSRPIAMTIGAVVGAAIAHKSAGNATTSARERERETQTQRQELEPSPGEDT